MPSDDWYSNIYPPPGEQRITVAEVTYSLIAPEAKEGGDLYLPPGNEFSRDDQVLNAVQHIEYPVATFEPGYWKLDGTFVMPLPATKSDIEVGWWSDMMSDENGILNPPQVIIRTFDMVQAFTSLGIAFDKQTNNYCTDFEAFFYDINENLIYHEHITDNDSYYGRTFEAGFNIIKVVIVLHKTNQPFRYVRVSELDFGVYLKFDEDDIKSITAISETDYMGKCFILPEFTLSILNKDRFRQLDTSSYAPFMQTRQKFEYRHGLVLPDGSVEFVDCGSYILKDWSVSDSLVSFTATGINSELEKITFFDSSFEWLTMVQFVKKLFPSANISLDSPKFPAYVGNINKRQALTYLLELSSCLVYEDRQNIIQFLDVINETQGAITWNYKLDGSWQLGEKPFANMDTINYANMFNKPNPKLSEYYNGINLSEYIMSTEGRQISKTEHKVKGIIKIAVFFNAPVIGIPTMEITPGFILSDIIWNTMYMTATLVGNGVAEITITGQSVTLAKEQTFFPAPWNSGRESEHPYAIDLPMMIRTGEYEIFRDWFLARKFKMLFKRLNADIRWRQNPAQLIGDTVAVQLNKESEKVHMIAARQELNYRSGALKGNTKLIGEVDL